MPKISPYIWGSVVISVALLNIVDMLPDWATFAAILTLPFMAASNGARCRRAKS
ncbi:hypothetical protein [Alteriqipengyuania sp.]|uniref:hypothetical protein n=1 Tax=Alteriqipengyuania sp. TaxID=2800692 RepID=UPI003515592B